MKKGAAPRPHRGHSAPRDFNPKSPDAMFAVILERLDKQDRVTEERHEENKEKLSEICEQTTLTNGRVTQHDKDIAALRSKWKEAFAWIGGATFVAGVLWVLFVHFTK
jgi:hypothetical protein